MDLERSSSNHPMRYIMQVYGLWTAIANFATIIVCVQLLRKRRDSGKEGTTWVILHMSFADAWSGFQSFVALTRTNGDLSRVSDAACRVLAALVTLTSGQSILMVLLLGYVRYKLLMQCEIPVRTVKISIALGWLTSTFLAVLLIGLDGTTLSPSRYMCAVTHNSLTVSATILTVTGVLLCTVPAALLLVFYTRAFWSIRKEEAFIGKTQFSSRVARLGVAVVGVFFVTILPYAAVLMKRLAIPAEEDPDAAAIDRVVSFLVAISLGVNPILCFAFQRDFRVLALELMPYACLKHLNKFSSTASSKTSSQMESNAPQDKVEAQQVDEGRQLEVVAGCGAPEPPSEDSASTSPSAISA